MNYKRFHYGFIGLLCLSIIIFIGSAYEIGILFNNKGNHLVNIKAKFNSLQSEQTSINQDKKDILKYTILYQVSKSIVPQNKDQTQAVRQIINIANSNHISIASINFPPSSLGNNVPGAVTTPGAAPTQAAPAPSASTGAASSSSSNLSQLTAVPAIPGVYELQINIQSNPNIPCSYAELIGFLQGLENNRLTALVNSLTITPNASNPSVLSFSMTLDIYIKPGN